MKSVKFEVDWHEEILEFVISEVSTPVTTKTGAVGRMVLATILYRGEAIRFGWAIYHPLDTYNFSVGAKKAMERLLSKSPSKEARDLAWKKFLEVFPPSETELWKVIDVSYETRTWEALVMV